VFWGSYEIHQPHKIEETFQALTEMYAKGHLKPVTCAVYPLVRSLVAADAGDVLVGVLRVSSSPPRRERERVID
jgi:hypothetical protein